MAEIDFMGLERARLRRESMRQQNTMNAHNAAMQTAERYGGMQTPDEDKIAYAFVTARFVGVDGKPVGGGE